MAGAHARGTYGVMMRERAEMVVRVQTGEISGVGLHTKEAGSESAVCSVQHTRSATSNTVTSTMCTSVFLISGVTWLQQALGMQLLRQALLSLVQPTHALTAPTHLLVPTGLVAPTLWENYTLYIINNRSLGTKAKNYSEQANVIQGRQTS